MPETSKEFMVIEELKTRLAERIHGQDELLKLVVIAALTNSHVLIEGLPGTAKTFTVTRMSKILYGKEFNRYVKRVQFIPDLQPSDLLGGIVPRLSGQSQVGFVDKNGPVFTEHLFIADEINRAPSKVQAALLQVMAEREISRVDRDAPESVNPDQLFSCFATQNPIEQEGTYPLSEAALDRFLFKVVVPLPPSEVLEKIGKHHNDEEEDFFEPKELDREDGALKRRGTNMKALLSMTFAVKVPDYVYGYMARLCEATYGRPKPFTPGLGDLHRSIIYDYLVCGVSPRAMNSLITAAKGHAFFNQRDYATVSDVQEMAPYVLNHRLRLTFEALSKKAKNNFKFEAYVVEEILANVATTL